jgi:hypothetical protein
MMNLAVIDGLALDPALRGVLRPGETMRDRHGRERTLPRWFLRVESWEEALQTQLTTHFALWELIGVDVREARPVRGFPRYVPCALLLLATALEVFRQEVGTYVHVAANGGYRSPGHGLSRFASRHCWGTAANIYRIGDTYLEDSREVEKYAAIAQSVIPGVWTRPVGSADGESDDHLHLDLGFVMSEPMQ